MKMLSWLLLLFATFCVALMLVLTFTQPEFKQDVSLKLIVYTIPKIPLYLFVLGAFTTGLGFGLITALIGYLKAKVTGMKKNKKIKELEAEIALLSAPAASQSFAAVQPQSPRS